MQYRKTYSRWLSKVEDETLLQELQRIEFDESAVEDRFYRELEFGTGGLRGVLGAGTNRMNIYTVAKATQGYSNYLKKTVDRPSVAIAYDSRINSSLFAQTAASVFAENGIRVHIYPKLMPTPSLSFAVRDLKCDGGVVITASHNPGKYNGYKVYGTDGCQITTEAAKAIQKEIDSVDVFDDVYRGDFFKACEEGKISYIDEDTVRRYMEAIYTASVLPGGIDKNVSIVYTPLNGAGISCVPDCLISHGFTNITIPEAQRNPDGNFPTCPYPNPEIREALEVGLECARVTGSDMLLATDPDCDRVGVAVKEGHDYVLISGNEMGVLLLDFVCRMRISQGSMPETPVAVKTIVTTPMAARVAKYYGVELRDVLTGFKFIGEQIGILEKEGRPERYIFGFEESYGYLSGSFVRDKDAVNASLLICEMFVWYKSQNISLVQALQNLYDKFGYYGSRLLTFTFEGSAGFSRMQGLIDSLRISKPADFSGYAVSGSIDYQNEETGLPKSNVLRFFLENGGEVVVRPSGTEPKLKIYLTAVGNSATECDSVLLSLERAFSKWVEY